MFRYGERLDITYFLQWKKGLCMGGSKRNVEPKDDNPYSWLSYGLDVMETGASLILDGIRHQRKAVGLMQKCHEAMDEDPEEDI